MPKKRKFDNAITRFEKRLCITVSSLICDKFQIPYDRSEPYPILVSTAIKHLETIAAETWADNAVLDLGSD